MYHLIPCFHSGFWKSGKQINTGTEFFRNIYSLYSIWIKTFLKLYQNFSVCTNVRYALVKPFERTQDLPSRMDICKAYLWVLNLHQVLFQFAPKLSPFAPKLRSHQKVSQFALKCFSIYIKTFLNLLQNFSPVESAVAHWWNYLKRT